MLDRYYQQELAYLREMGRELVEVMPEAAPYLGDASRDPDVERMLEGFAFLAGQIRQKLDDELPEITHSVLEMLAPHLLQPIPSTTIVQFSPGPQAVQTVHTLPSGMALDSVPVDGTKCRFVTGYPVDLVPLAIEAVHLNLGVPSDLRLRLRLLPNGSLKDVDLDRIRLFLVGDAPITRGLFRVLLDEVERVAFRKPTDGTPLDVPPDEHNGGPLQILDGAGCEPVGFHDHEALVGDATDPARPLRLLLEYFAVPEKFLFVDLHGLGPALRDHESGVVDLHLQLRHTPDEVPPISHANFALNCTPAINRFEHGLDPVPLFELERREFSLRAANGPPQHYEVIRPTQVVGVRRGARGSRRTFYPLMRLEPGAGEASNDGPFYLTQRRAAISLDGSQLHIVFIDDDGRGDRDDEAHDARASHETVSIDAICTNRQLPAQLSPGDVCEATSDVPAFTTFRNITKPTRSVPPPLGHDAYWRLVAHMAVDVQSLAEPDVLRATLELYDFSARVDRQRQQFNRLLRDAITDIRCSPSTHLLDGVPVRGVEIQLTLDDEKLPNAGERFFFGTVLDRVYADSTRLNSFSRLVIRNKHDGGTTTWPIRFGHRLPL